MRELWVPGKPALIVPRPRQSMFMLNQLVGFGVGSQELVWVDGFGPITLDTNSSSWAGYNLRQVLDFVRNGTFVRITFQAPTDSSLVVPNVYIGGRMPATDADFLTTPTEVKFNSGSSGFSLSASGSIVSDPLAFTIDVTLQYLLAHYVTSGNGRYLTAGSLWYKSAANETSVADVSGYTGLGRIQGVSRIEVAGITTTYAMWNLSDKSGLVALSNGNRTATISGSGLGAVRATKGLSAGKWYWEVKPTTIANSNAVGLGKSSAGLSGYVGLDANGWGFFSNGNIWNNSSNILSITGFAVNDIVMVAFDADTGKLYFGVNGSWRNSGDPVAGTGACVTGLTSGPYYPMVSDGSSANDINALVANFNPATFIHTPPVGFEPVTL